MKNFFFLSLLLFTSAKTFAQKVRDTTWLGSNNRVLQSAEGAERYILKDTLINGRYQMKGFYMNGQLYKDGYAESKRAEGGYSNGKISWYDKNGNVKTIQEFKKDSSWGKRGDGTLIYLSDGIFNTDYYKNGKPARRYHEGLNRALRNEAYRFDDLLDLQEKGLFKQAPGPEAELYYDNGQRAMTVDIKKKTFISWYENGVKAMEMLLTPQHYLLKKYYRNGQPESEEVLDEKLRANGAYSYFYTNGVLREKGSREGEWSVNYTGPVYKYYPNGKLHSITEQHRKGHVVEEPKVDVINEGNAKPVKDYKAPGKIKIANPDVFTYFDINGKQAFKYTENDTMPAGVFDYFTKQVSTLLDEQLTAEEKKYPVFNTKALQREHGTQEFDTRYKLNDAFLNGHYVEKTGREIRIYSFNDGRPAGKKTYISFDEELGIYRAEASFPGLRFKRDLLLQARFYDEEERLMIEANNITGFTRKQGPLYTMEQQGNGKYPDITYHFVPQVVRALRNPGYFIVHSGVMPATRLIYSEEKKEEYERLKKLVEEYMKQLEER